MWKHEAAPMDDKDKLKMRIRFIQFGIFFLFSDCISLVLDDVPVDPYTQMLPSLS